MKDLIRLTKGNHMKHIKHFVTHLCFSVALSKMRNMSRSVPLTRIVTVIIIITFSEVLLAPVVIVSWQFLMLHTYLDV